MAKRQTTDWDTITRFKARAVVASLKKSMPSEWGRAVEILAVSPEGVPVWLRAPEWLARVEAFKKLHGEALAWAIGDAEICDRARDYAQWVEQLIELKGEACCDAERVDKVCALCDVVGVDHPKALTAAGAVARVCSDVWWRRVLRKKVARVVEHGAIKLGIVNRRDGGYASAGAVRRRQEQIARNAAMLEKTLMRNEAGQVFTLAELAKSSVANPEIRGGELMVRIRGCEEFATEAGHVGYFLTLTCPSRFHAVTVRGKGARAVARVNPFYDGVSTPRDAQAWLRTRWARVRAQWAREGLNAYGFRVAEPHHDGCPHWHALLWFENEAAALSALSGLGAHWLGEGGAVESFPCREDVIVFKAGAGSEHERGSLKNRINIKRMIKGGAAGYVAKYVAKNIGHFDVGVHLDGMEVDTREVKGWQRVDAWASTWGIRQFQAIGQPSVTVWREMRRVTKDQVEDARVGGDAVAWRVWGAVHKVGDMAADWKRYLIHQGGVCRARVGYAIKTALRIEPGSVNGYGEAYDKKKVIGCEVAKSGRVLVSRRQSWARVCEFDDSAVLQSSEERAALGASWTGFNNCTARLGGMLRAAMMGLKSEGVGYEVNQRFGT